VRWCCRKLEEHWLAQLWKTRPLGLGPANERVRERLMTRSGKEIVGLRSTQQLRRYDIEVVVPISKLTARLDWPRQNRPEVKKPIRISSSQRLQGELHLLSVGSDLLT